MYYLFVLVRSLYICFKLEQSVTIDSKYMFIKFDIIILC